MLKKIKNFFKWIADHTGISWIARKISSGWNWLLSSKKNTTQENTSPERPSSENKNKSNTIPIVSTPMQNETEESVSKTDINVEPAENFPERLNDEPKAVGEIKFKDNQFFLSLNKPLAEGEYTNLNRLSAQSSSLIKLLVYVKCGKNEYKIVGNDNGLSEIKNVLIEEVTKKNENGVYLNLNKIQSKKDNTYRIEEILGLENGVTKVKVDDISNQPFEGTALEQHNLNPTTAQQDEKGTKPSPTIGVPEAQTHCTSNPSKVGSGIIN
ncbi:hypothetical protein C1A_954 [Wolbachia endosymbiont of Culex quinquefasciatus JHB]|uniref:hypothetical protein n=1 Tax=unclassified Wolbachia TaxID=2640676 RepID=UPI0001761CD1|nr:MULTISPECIES: hypothetical protein [unclassified Wolbachia]EEB55932.1 hypothetical protein C1A_954 [Wolbachia endosymbiont of Culex quinquefasciatus JHB]UXX40758.1 hypothetical protein MJ631_02090 [Wolbachia endosymbiont of Oryzaephilus surinamensis]CAQ54212.1 Hypothetical protein WP0104 [Wolbachia endosymbiont of Culex quinquefasciatus Pel]